MEMLVWEVTRPSVGLMDRTFPTTSRIRLSAHNPCVLNLTIIQQDISKTNVPPTCFPRHWEKVMGDCHRCREIIAWLQGHEEGLTLRCPFCKVSYTKGKRDVLDEAGNVVSEAWQVSLRPARCPACGWSGPLRDIRYLGCGCFPFRCPKCGGIVAQEGDGG